MRHALCFSTSFLAGPLERAINSSEVKQQVAKNVMQNECNNVTSMSVPRRRALQLLCSTVLMLPLNALAASGSASERRSLEYPELRGLDEQPDNLPPFRSVNGVQIQDVSVGNENSTAVSLGTQVSIKYVLRRSNGYFIDASYGFDRFETFQFRPGGGSVIRGFDIGVEGMHEGGRRRFVVPPQLGYVSGTAKQDPGPIPPDFGARRSLSAHSREALIFEVAVVRVRPVEG